MPIYRPQIPQPTLCATFSFSPLPDLSKDSVMLKRPGIRERWNATMTGNPDQQNSMLGRLLPEHRIFLKTGEDKTRYFRITPRAQAIVGGIALLGVCWSLVATSALVLGVVSADSEASQAQVIHDAYEDRIAELTLELAKKDELLAQVNQSMSEFVYMASHDLMGPSRRIQGFAKLLQKKLPKQQLEGEISDFFRFLMESSELMSMMITDIVHISRLKPSGYEWQTVELPELLESVVNEFGERDHIQYASAKPPVLHWRRYRIIRNSATGFSADLTDTWRPDFIFDATNNLLVANEVDQGPIPLDAFCTFPVFAGCLVRARFANVGATGGSLFVVEPIKKNKILVETVANMVWSKVASISHDDNISISSDDPLADDIVICDLMIAKIQAEHALQGLYDRKT